MKNLDIAKFFYQIADYLDLKKISFKPYAYRKAARFLESFGEDVEDIYKKGGVNSLKKLPAIGESMAWHIEEYIKTGRLKEYENLKKENPVEVKELLAVEGIGPKKTVKLYEKLKIKNLKELEKAAKEHRIRDLEGFGVNSEEQILQGIEFVKRQKGRSLLGYILFTVEYLVNKLSELKEVKKVQVAGSVRRMKETIGDVDLLVAAEKDQKKIVDFFTNLPEVEKIWSQGETKVSVRLKQGFDADLRIVEPKSYGSALQYFTGNKDHNISLRNIAIKKGYKLNEYGLWKEDKQIAGGNEKEIYEKLGLQYIEPELRTNTGEIETALNKNLPNLIKYNDIKGDLHIHTDWSDGEDSIEDMVKKAKEMGYEYIAITDHSLTPINSGLDAERFKKQWKEIDGVSKKINGIKILKGAETNILKDGKIDLDEEILAQFDIVIAGVHSNFKMGKENMTKRIMKAMENKYVDIISHPTGRLIGKRPAYEVDMEKIFDCAKETGTILEINSFSDRLDLADFNIRRAVQKGVFLAINTDSHSVNHFSHIKLGIATARRGWAEKENIVNTNSFDVLIKKVKKEP